MFGKNRFSGILSIGCAALVLAVLVGCGGGAGTPAPVSLDSWQAVAVPIITAEVNNITYGNGKFIASTYSGTTAAYSTDGITWTEATNLISEFTGVTIRPWFVNGEFFAGSSTAANSLMVKSSDGINWTVITQTAMTNSIYAFAYGDGKYVAVGRAGTAAFSPDGTNWTAVSNTVTIFTTSAAINSVVYGGTKFVAVGQLGKSAYSIDGETWTDTSATTTGTEAIFGNSGNGSGIKMVAYGNGKFVAVGQAKAAISNDGIDWVAVDLSGILGAAGSGSWLNGIIFADGRFVAGGGNGQLIYSTDGLNWTKSTGTESIVGIGNYINCIAFGAGRFVAGHGGSNSIMYTVE
jgi:hypothetical protein